MVPVPEAARVAISRFELNRIIIASKTEKRGVPFVQGHDVTNIYDRVIVVLLSANLKIGRTLCWRIP